MNHRKLITVPLNNQERFITKAIPILKNLDSDILVVDDGSTDRTYGIIKNYPWLKYIKHEQRLGNGASFITAYEYARDMDYDVIITLDHCNIRYREEISQLMENIVYGYDIVNSSRILENYDHQNIPSVYIETTDGLSDAIKDVTGYDLTDPLSGIKAMRMGALKSMELTEFNHGLFLQLWIQAHYFELPVIEIPAQSGIGFGDELAMYDDPLGLFLSFIETENFIYSHKDMHH